MTWVATDRLPMAEAAPRIRRPLLRWHGGKWRLASWIIAQFPAHRVYVEPFGGAASILLRKPRSYAEIYNDLDGEVVNLFRVLRSNRAGELVDALALTPYARDEFELAYEPHGDPVEQARRLVVRSFMGFGSDSPNTQQRTGFRANCNRSHSTPAHDWINYPTALRMIVERLRGVVIENREATEVMAHQDGPETLHYLDPPYMPGTRSQKSRKGGLRYHAYRHEMSEADHAALLADAKNLSGAVIISGYHTELYDDVLSSWMRLERPSLADGARKRTEVLWLNAAAESRGTLFDD